MIGYTEYSILCPLYEVRIAQSEFNLIRLMHQGESIELYEEHCSVRLEEKSLFVRKKNGDGEGDWQPVVGFAVNQVTRTTMTFSEAKRLR